VAVNLDDVWKADAVRAFLPAKKVSPSALRSAISSIPPDERDAWVDRVFGLDAYIADGPELPRGCSPYLACPVDAVIAAIDEAAIDNADVFVDIGSGAGRVGLLVRLLTGAAVIGLEVQSALVAASRRHAQELKLERFSVVLGDASQLVRYVPIGSVFFFYCPFGGPRLDRVIDDLEAIAKMRTLRLCGVNTRFPDRPWLGPVHRCREDLMVYRTLAHRTFQRT